MRGQGQAKFMRHRSTAWFVTCLATVIALLVNASPSLAAKGGFAMIGGPISGTTGGLFNTPGGVAVNQAGVGGVPAGTIYVADSSNHRIQRFNPDGSFHSLWGQDVVTGGVTTFEACSSAPECKAGITAPQTGGSLNNPQAVAVDQSDGSVYVSDQGNRRIQKFSATGDFIWAAGWDVVSTGPGNDIIGTTNQFETCVAASGDTCKIAAAAGANAGQLAAISTGIAVNQTNGQVIIADSTNRRIQVFSSAGAFVSANGYDVIPIGQTGDTGVILEGCPAAAAEVTGGCRAGQTTNGGNNPGQFSNNQPTSVAADFTGAIYAVESSGNNRLQQFDPAATSASIFAPGLLSGAPAPTRVATDPSSDHVYVAKGGSEGGIGVFEFDGSGDLIETHGADLPPATGLALRDSDGNLYYSTTEEHRIIILGTVVNPTASLNDITTFSSTTATFSGLVNPQGFPTGYHFEYSTDGNNWARFPAADVAVGGGSSDVPVSQEVTGLVGSQPYQVRLVATKAFAGGTATTPAKTFITDAEAPVVSGTDASLPSDTAVTLSARVNPQNQATTWHFEYVEQDEFEASGFDDAVEIPAPEASAGSGGVPVDVSQEVTDLAPSTAYRYRFVATNPTGITEGPDGAFITYPSVPNLDPCPNDEFRIGPGARLPDCRAYEQATPTDKNGNDALGDDGAVQASPAGDAITFDAVTGFPSSDGGQEFIFGLARRGADSWSSQGAMAPASWGEVSGVVGWTSDLAYFFHFATVLGTPGTTLLSRSSVDGSIETVVPYTPNATYDLVGASADGSRVFFEAKGNGVQLTPEAAGPNENNLYVWDRESGELDLVGILPDSACGSPPCVPAGGSFAAAFDWFSGTTSTTLGKGGADEKQHTQEQHAISADGSKAFFTAGDTGQIYVRENAGEVGASTVHVSASQRAVLDPNGTKPAIFHRATPDGSLVFFTSCEKLTDDSTAVSTADNTCATVEQGQDLYAYDTGSGELADLTVDLNGNPNGADVRGVIGASDDGSTVYFVANGVLASGASPGDCRGQATGNFEFEGTCNLYLWKDGEVTFIARQDLSNSSNSSDAANWQPDPLADGNGLQQRTGRVSSNGVLLFRSQLPLAGYDNSESDASSCEGGVIHDICPQFFYYSPSEELLTCVSCNPTGALPTDTPTLQRVASQNAQSGNALTRSLSADGSKVFFETADKLVVADSNGDSSCPQRKGSGASPARPICLDVYMWEASGSGSCQSETQNNGCLYLLSQGTSSEPSLFADASASGDEAFFFTRDALVPQDRDQLQDIYSARTGSVFASQYATPPIPCEGEGSCRDAVGALPDTPGAGSGTFQGPGNPQARRRKSRSCPTGKREIRRSGKTRCVKRKKQQSKQRGRNHNRRITK